MIKMTKSAFLLLLVFIFPISVFAQTGNVEGIIYQRSTGKPLKGADVHIIETDQHQKTTRMESFGSLAFL